MNTKKDTGIFQLDNGYWGYRYKEKIEGVLKESRRTIDELGKPFKTKNLDIISLSLIDDNHVIITFKGNGTRKVNIEATATEQLLLTL